MTEAYENDEEFKLQIIACGRALDIVETAIRSIRFKIIFYFETFEIYQQPHVEKFIVRELRGSLNQEEFSIFYSGTTGWS
jgi:hypothetical protein